MTDTLETPNLPPEPPSPPRRNPALTALTVLAILAVIALGIVAVVATTRDNGTTMMGTNGMPGSMMSNGQMMNGSMTNGPMMGHASSSPTIPGAREIAITASALKFAPAEIHVRAGEDVTIVLTATDTTHDFTIDEFGFHVAATPGQAGRGSFHAPPTAGQYTAYCSVAGHRQAGMTATVIVDPA
jgi:heme/copper-type cytochrome/quinol oxidase subunit 2